MKTNIYPFGTPDGARETNCSAQYINAHEADFEKISFIVGAKGSGKTFCLKVIKDSLSQAHSIMSNPSSLPQSKHIIGFTLCFNEDDDIFEYWQQFWKSAIILTLLSQVLSKDALSTCLNFDCIQRLLEYVRLLHPKLIKNYHIEGISGVQMVETLDLYSSANAILCEYTKREKIIEYLDKPEWDFAINYLTEISHDLPCIYLLTDCIDEDFASAPLYWMNCQKGLFYQSIRFIRNLSFGGNIRIITVLRDQTLLSACKTFAYTPENDILQLSWSFDKAKIFFENKIRKLIGKKFKRNTSNVIELWLGVYDIEDKHRKKREPIVTYILRHTRFTPRDIVHMGNALSQIKNDINEKEAIEVESRIRKYVHETAYFFGHELLIICATQLKEDFILNGEEANSKFEAQFTPAEEYKESAIQILREIIGSFRSESISWNRLRSISNEYSRKYSSENIKYFFDVLWQNGGIGYIDCNIEGEEEETFICDIGYREFHLPKRKKKYVLRGCIYDYVGIPEGFLFNEHPTIGGRV